MQLMLRLFDWQGAVTMRDGLLGAVVDHLLSLDVEIKWQDIAERPGMSKRPTSMGLG